MTFRGRAAVLALARRLEAAWVSFDRGIGMDYALRRYVKQPRPYWVERAERMISKRDQFERSLAE